MPRLSWLKQSEVWWADLGSYRPREQTGRRPVVVWIAEAVACARMGRGEIFFIAAL
jgi:mRNA-degrading endonuclease toxin of MazEF toxin-antitoxin module